MEEIVATEYLQGKTILCVEDEGLILTMYRKGLSLAGAQVIEAFDGEQALEALKLHKVDIILLDLEMPNLDGFETLRVLRTLPQFDHIPVLILSNASRVVDNKTIVLLKEMGAVGAVLKSNISLRSLIAHISELLKESGKSV